MSDVGNKMDSSAIRSKIEECMSLEKQGDIDRAKICYSEAYQLITRSTGTEDAGLKQRRSVQAETLKLKLDSLSNDLRKEEKSEESFLIALQDLGVRVLARPSRKFGDLSGLDKAKKTLLLNVVYPIRFQELSREFNIKGSHGILLYGPPGNGKTLIAESVAGEADIKFLEVNPAFLYNELFGKFEKNLTKLFHLARELSPCVIFFDEVDTLMPRRDHLSESVIRRGVSQFLIEINKIMEEEGSQIFIIAATNLPWEIDPAMLRPGRFDLKLYIPPPDLGARRDMFRRCLANSHYNTAIDVDYLAKLTEGFSAADIIFVCRKSSENVFLETINGGKSRVIDQKDLIEAISNVTPSISRNLVKRYEECFTNI